MHIINLLPKKRQQELRYESMFGSLLTLFIFSLLTFVLVIGMQFVVKFYLNYQAESIKHQITLLREQVNKQQNSDVKNKVKNINAFIAQYNQLAVNSPKWSKVIKAFAVLPPKGVKINSFVVNSLTNTVNINGLSPTRELVIELYNKIKADDKNFYDVDYPLENVAKPVNVNFHFTFHYKPDLIK